MKNYFLPFIFTALYLGFSGCSKDSTLLEADSTLQNRTAGIFQDTTGLEFDHIINILSEQSDSMISFQTNYGYPSLDGTFTKRNESIKITTIPLVKRNKITGIFRIYITHEDSVNIHFFPIEMIDSLLTTYLASHDYHLLNGAIQSYVFSTSSRNETIDNKYIQWLQNNQNRLEERVGFFCIEDWDCYGDPNSLVDLIVIRNGYPVNLPRPNGNNMFGFIHCWLLEFECFYDYGDSNPIPRFGNNWNHYPWTNTSSTGGAGTGNNDPKVKPWQVQVVLDAKDCLQDAGINGAIVKAGLEDAAKNSCGKSYDDLLAETYINLFEQNKDCTDGEAWMEEMKNTINKESGFGSTLDPSKGDPITSTNRLCPDGIIVKPSEYSPNYQNVAGFSGLQISLNGGSVNLTFENLFFDVDQTYDCGISTQQLIADAVNSAITIANMNLASNLPISNISPIQNVQFAKLIEQQIKQIGINLGCTAKYDPTANQTTTPPSFGGKVIPSNYKNSLVRDCHEGAQFTKFEDLKTTGNGGC